MASSDKEQGGQNPESVADVICEWSVRPFAAIFASAAFFLETNAAPDVAFAIWMRARRAFCKRKIKEGF